MNGVRFAVNPQFLAVEASEDNKRTLRQKLVPQSRGSDRVLAEARLPSAQSYRLTQSVYLEPGFEYCGKNKSGKLGFGFGGGLLPAMASWLPTGEYRRNRPPTTTKPPHTKSLNQAIFISGLAALTCPQTV